MLAKKSILTALFLGLILIPFLLGAQVLGPCGKKPTMEKDVEVTVHKMQHHGPKIKRISVPLPGQPAIDFQLTAVVGDEIKQIKLSDYQGKWRVLCFFPAAFTFV